MKHVRISHSGNFVSVKKCQVECCCHCAQCRCDLFYSRAVSRHADQTLRCSSRPPAPYTPHLFDECLCAEERISSLFIRVYRLHPHIPLLSGPSTGNQSASRPKLPSQWLGVPYRKVVNPLHSSTADTQQRDEKTNQFGVKIWKVVCSYCFGQRHLRFAYVARLLCKK